MLSSCFLRLAPFAVLVAPIVPLPAQSATDDSDLFSSDEQVLRIGDEDSNITFAPFVQFDGGPVWLDPGEDDWQGETALARLYVFGQLGDLSGTLAYDFESDVLRYAFLGYAVTDRLTIRVGQQDEPFSLQDFSGSRFLPFATSGQSAALIPGDNLGATALYGGENYSLALGVFGGTAETGFDDNGTAVTGRATWAPIYSQSEIERGGDATQSGTGTQRVDDLLHLGIGLSARFDIDDPVSFSGGGGSSLVPISLSSTPSIPDIDSLLRANVEVSRQISSLSLQGEFTAARLDAPAIEGTATGGYLYATYFLTGERRGYSRSSGTFGRVIPIAPVDEGGFGAIEVGARVDYLDLTDLGNDVLGRAGAQWGATAVLNAYLTKRITLNADYSLT
ncbi:MAG: OprO/OprP family phosphate-selective porin, partial [Erythrobacter sp.]|nr:OprO/OprP family phosphate-selective porin [Erythrobacter sp.]